MHLVQQGKLSLTSPKHLPGKAVSPPQRQARQQVQWNLEGLPRVIPHLLTKTSHSSHMLRMRIVFRVRLIMQTPTQKMEYKASRDSVPKAMSKSTTSWWKIKLCSAMTVLIGTST